MLQDFNEAMMELALDVANCDYYEESGKKAKLVWQCEIDV